MLDVTFERPAIIWLRFPPYRALWSCRGNPSSAGRQLSIRPAFFNASMLFVQCPSKILFRWRGNRAEVGRARDGNRCLTLQLTVIRRTNSGHRLTKEGGFVFSLSFHYILDPWYLIFGGGTWKKINTSRPEIGALLLRGPMDSWRKEFLFPLGAWSYFQWGKWIR